DYAQINAAGGRIVDVVPLAVGYWSTYPKSAYRPWVVVEYRIYDAQGRTSIATGSIGAGPSPNAKPIDTVPQDDRFAFPDFDAVRENPDRALDGLKATIDQVAAALAAKL